MSTTLQVSTSKEIMSTDKKDTSSGGVKSIINIFESRADNGDTKPAVGATKQLGNAIDKKVTTVESQPTETKHYSAHKPTRSSNLSKPNDPSISDSSESTAGESVSAGSEDTLPRPHPLVRKKSGELVKSSLKLSSLPRAMSTPNVKSVRFAARIANIKMFDGTESPSAVSTRESSPVHSPRRARGHDYFQMHEEDSDTSEEEVQHKHKEVKYSLVFSDVPQYEPQVKPTDSLNLHSLRLDRDDDDRTILCGLINCANLAFEKNLMIKLTWDNWASNISFSNAPTITFHRQYPIANVDQFQFRIPLCELHHHSKYNSEVSIQFCIQYRTANKVFWDNNHGKNYHIRLKPKSTISSYTYTPDERDDGQFDELVTKLMTIQKREQAGYSPRRTIHSRYNFGSEPSDPAPPVRPALKTSLSANDVTRRYSQSYKKRNEKKENEKEDLNKGDLAKSSIASLSYTDLLANYCFSGGSKKVTTGAHVIPRSVSSSVLNTSSFGFASNSFGSSCSPASAFHAFSDSIHT